MHLKEACVIPVSAPESSHPLFFSLCTLALIQTMWWYLPTRSISLYALNNWHQNQNRYGRCFHMTPRRKRVEGSSIVPKSLLYSKPGIHSGCDRFRMAIVQQKKEIVVLEHVWVQSLRYQRSFTCILQIIVILRNVLKWPERRPEPGSSIKVKERMHGPENINVMFIVCFLLLIQV